MNKWIGTKEVLMTFINSENGLVAMEHNSKYGDIDFHNLWNPASFGSTECLQSPINDLTCAFEDMYRANHHLWSCISELHTEQLMVGVGHEEASIHSLLLQMITNENLWINYLWHVEVEYLRETDFPTLTKIRLELDALEAEMRDYLSILTLTDLEQKVNLSFVDASPLRLGAILWQVIDDAASYRTQILAGIHQLCVHVIPHTE